MITLTLFDSKQIVLNADLIEFVEETPDTVISLTDGKKVVVKETVSQVVQSVIRYKQSLSSSPGPGRGERGHESDGIGLKELH